MKNNKLLFPLFMFVILGIIKQVFGLKASIIAAGVLFVMIAITIFVQHILFERRFKVCPNCGAKTHKVWHKHLADPQKERVTLGTTRILFGTVTMRNNVICCDQCGWSSQNEKT